MSERQNKSSGGLSASSASGSSRRRSGSRSKEDFAKFQDYKRTLSRSASQSGSKSQSGSSKSSRKAGSKKTRTKSACQSGSKSQSGSSKSSRRSGVKTPRAKAESVSIQVKSSPKMVKNSIRSRRPKANQGCWSRFQKNTQNRYNIGSGAFYAIVVTVALFILGGVGFLGWLAFKKRSTESGKPGIELLLNKSKERTGMFGALAAPGSSHHPVAPAFVQSDPNVVWNMDWLPEATPRIHDGPLYDENDQLINTNSQRSMVDGLFRTFTEKGMTDLEKLKNIMNNFTDNWETYANSDIGQLSLLAKCAISMYYVIVQGLTTHIRHEPKFHQTLWAMNTGKWRHPDARGFVQKSLHVSVDRISRWEFDMGYLPTVEEFAKGLDATVATVNAKMAREEFTRQISKILEDSEMPALAQRFRENMTLPGGVATVALRGYDEVSQADKVENPNLNLFKMPRKELLAQKARLRAEH